MAFGLPSFQQKNTNPYGPQGPNFRKIILFSVLGFILLVIILLVMNTILSAPKDSFMTFLGREQFLSDTVAGSQKRIRSGDLAKLNSDSTLLLSSDNVALLAQLQKKFNQTKLDDTTKKQQVDATVATSLKSAELLDKFDVTYRNILLEKIDQLLATAPSVRDSLGGNDFKAVMNKYINDLRSIESQLDALNL